MIKTFSYKFPLLGCRNNFLLGIFLILIFPNNAKADFKVPDNKDYKHFDICEQNPFMSVRILNTVSKESIEKTKTKFLKWNVILEFDNLKYSADGSFITSVEVRFENLKTGKIGSIDKEDSKGITPFVIYVYKNGITGFRDISPEEVAEQKANSSFKGIGSNPHYIINNIEYKSSDLAGKSIYIKHNLEILKSDDAQIKFGDKAKDGAIIIYDGVFIENFKEEICRIDEDQIEMFRHYLQIKNNDYSPSFTRVHCVRVKENQINNFRLPLINNRKLNNTSPKTDSVARKTNSAIGKSKNND